MALCALMITLPLPPLNYSICYLCYHPDCLCHGGDPLWVHEALVDGVHRVVDRDVTLPGYIRDQHNTGSKPNYALCNNAGGFLPLNDLFKKLFSVFRCDRSMHPLQL